MMRRFIWNVFAVAALFAVVLLIPSATTLAQQVAPVTSRPLPTPDTSIEPQAILLSAGQTQLIELPLPARDVIVANPAIADIIVKTPTRAYLIGQAFGRTNIFFVGENGDVILHLAVQVDVELAAANEAIKSLVPEAKVELKALNGGIVMTGTVPSAKSSADVANLVRRFLGVGGEVELVNMLRILGDLQVILKVRISEIARTVTKSFGISSNIDKTLNSKRFVLNSTPGVPANAFGTGTLVINALGIGTVSYGALESRGLTKTLAEPVLTAISGETANFLAGGSFPSAVGTDDAGQPVFELQEFGVGLSFTPVVLANNQISLRISTEVSSISAENSTVTDSGVTLRGLATRRAETTVTLPSGGHIMIAGLVRNNNSTTVQGMPWLKDLPILGALFRSQSFQNDETELVVSVSAYVVRPIAFANKLALPTDGFIPASEADMYLLGELHKRYTGKRPLKAPRTVIGPIGYIME